MEFDVICTDQVFCIHHTGGRDGTVDQSSLNFKIAHDLVKREV
jgi:hypothetical protein